LLQLRAGAGGKEDWITDCASAGGNEKWKTCYIQ